jgi:hypothetical protein
LPSRSAVAGPPGLMPQPSRIIRMTGFLAMNAKWMGPRREHGPNSGGVAMEISVSGIASAVISE